MFKSVKPKRTGDKGSRRERSGVGGQWSGGGRCRGDPMWSPVDGMWTNHRARHRLAPIENRVDRQNWCRARCIVPYKGISMRMFVIDKQWQEKQRRQQLQGNDKPVTTPRPFFLVFPNFKLYIFQTRL